jgi:hypothetical protein
MLPIARKDLERLAQSLDMAPRLLDPLLPPRLQRSLPHRPAFPDALTWLELHGDDPDAVARWKHARRAPSSDADEADDPETAGRPHERRRRRRRRRRRGRKPPGGQTPGAAGQ